MLLRERIERLAERGGAEFSADDRRVFADFKAALNRGEVRAAERTAEGIWRSTVGQARHPPRLPQGALVTCR